MRATNRSGNITNRSLPPSVPMEQIVSRENMTKAYNRVKSNRGSAGIDGMHVHELKNYLQTHWSGIKASLLSGIYSPSGVLQVSIPKPGGGER